MQQYSIFRNRKESWWEKAKKKRGGSREFKVQELAGLDPPIPQIDYEEEIKHDYDLGILR